MKVKIKCLQFGDQNQTLGYARPTLSLSHTPCPKFIVFQSYDCIILKRFEQHGFKNLEDLLTADMIHALE